MSAASFLNTSHQTVAWFSDQAKLERLDLKPPFQRRPVWSNEEKSFLIDSMLRGYPVPEIYLQSGSIGENDTLAVVDGQQRLRACLEFLAGDFAISFNVEKLKPLYDLADTPWFGKRYSGLTPEERERFRRYKLIVRDIEGVDDTQVRHMFHRLNQSNFALNAQELRYSIYSGGLLVCAETLVKRDEWQHFRIFTKLQQRRMLDTEYITELIIGYLHWPQNKKDNIDNYYRQYADVFPFEQEVVEVFDRTLRRLGEVFPEARFGGTRWYRKSDFYTLFLALARGQIADSLRPRDLRSALTTLGALVDSSEGPDEAEAVTIYREAVGRAATDRARRVRREAALVSFVNPDPDGLFVDLDLAGESEEEDSVVEEDVDSETDAEYDDATF